MSQQNVSEDLQQSVRDAEPAKPASTPSPVASENAEVITLEPLQKPRSTGKATKYHQLNQPQPDNDTSPLAPPAAVSKITPISTASDKLAEINERVSRILAPVHALEALRSSPSSMNNGFSTFQANINTTPQPLGLQVPNLDPMPARTGNQRGRGSRRRGNDIASGAITFASNVPGTLLTPPNYSSRGRDGMHGRGSGTGRGRGAARGGKRRRSEDDSGKTSDTDASENFTPLTQSRSGRKIIHTAPSTPIIKIEDNDAKASPLAAKGNGSANGKGSGKKRGGYRRTPGGASAVCKNCGRGHSPLANTIVFCDGCNTPWHQFCHDPPIGKDIVTIAEKEWFCSDCIVMKEERVRLQGKVAGQNLSMLEVRIAHSFLLLSTRAKTDPC